MNEMKWAILENILTLAVFAAVAISFGKWWIILFSLLSMNTITTKQQ